MPNVFCFICKEEIRHPGVYQEDSHRRKFHPSCGARKYLTPVKEIHLGKNGRILKGGIGQAKVHYGMVGPVCNTGLPRVRKSLSHVLTTDPKQVTCKHCRMMIDLRDTSHVLHLKRNLGRK
jgi:hypothetical protein